MICARYACNPKSITIALFGFGASGIGLMAGLGGVAVGGIASGGVAIGIVAQSGGAVGVLADGIDAYATSREAKKR
jgi:hypothetical protein